jgi:PST family polysaccharide transporter
LKLFDRDGTFQATPPEVSRLAIRGAGATLLSSGLGLAIQIGSTLILARLLLPSDFGVVTMVTTFSLLALNFGVNGLIEAILQADRITHQLASNLFWINAGSGTLFTLAVAASGPLMARFYSDPRVTRVALGVSLSVLLTSTSVVHIALLNRALRFSWISANDVLARVASTVLSIVLAWLGWGYWALVVATVALPLSTAVGAWVMCGWLPALPRRAEGTGAIIGFALRTYGRFSLNYVSRNADNLLVGWRFGAVSLGFYKKAYDMFATPVSQSGGALSHVALAGLSRFKNDPDQYKRNLLSAISVLAFVGMGVGALLTLVGKDLIMVLLGSKWGPAGHIFTYFGPGIGIMLLYNSHPWIHYSLGKANRALRWGVIEVAATVLLFLLGLPWGPVGVAFAWTLSAWLLTVPAFWYAGKPIDLGIKPVIKVVWRYAAASGLAGCATALIGAKAHQLADAPGVSGALVRLVAVSSLLAVLYVLSVVVLHGGLTPITRFVEIVRQMVPLGAASRSSKSDALPVESGSEEAKLATVSPDSQ